MSDLRENSNVSTACPTSYIMPMSCRKAGHTGGTYFSIQGSPASLESGHDSHVLQVQGLHAIPLQPAKQRARQTCSTTAEWLWRL